MATPKQIEKVKALINEKDVSTETLRALFLKGILADMFSAKAEDVNVVNRSELHRLFKLAPYEMPMTAIINIEPENSLAPPYSNWSLLYDIEKCRGNIELELFDPFEPCDNWIFPEHLLNTRASHFGERCARELCSKQDAIPVSWQEAKIIFPATIWEHDNCREMPYIHFRPHEMEWALDYIFWRDILHANNRYLGGIWRGVCRK
jgi:hypothetical protein